MGSETIEHFIASGDQYEIYCHNARCRHHAKIDMAKLRDRLGPDHGCLHDDIIHLFKCSKCGGKELGLIRTNERTAIKGSPFYPEPFVKSNLYAKAKGS